MGRLAYSVKFPKTIEAIVKSRQRGVLTIAQIANDQGVSSPTVSKYSDHVVNARRPNVVRNVNMRTGMVARKRNLRVQNRRAARK
jgi:hypothetical protein